MTRRKVRSALVLATVCLVALTLATGAWAGEEKKVSGKVIAAPPELQAKYAPVALECEDGVYALVANAVAKKLEKKIGEKYDVTGEIQEIDGQKVVKAFLYVPSGAKPKKLPS
jgi:drug/metabolite transporter superfamily protein YnfA